MILNIKHDQIIIFSRYPVPGKTKTRLIPDIGALNAADLHKRMTEKTLRTAKKLTVSHNLNIEICFEGGNSDEMCKWLGDDLIYSRQVKNNLGRRMDEAIFQAFLRGYKRIVLIGTDIPELKTDHLKEAFHALNTHDVVLGPSTDGGYWLVGLKNNADIFKNISWGTDVVLNQTIKAVQDIGLTHYLLKPLTDIDTIDNIRQWRSSETISRPYVSVIIPAINEADNIEKAIASAWHKDVEIIVVDGGSTDKTVEKAKKAGARVIECLPGRSIQQNRGAALSKGSVLLFLHADTLLPEKYMATIFNAFLDSGTIAGAFEFRTDSKKLFMKIVHFFTNIRSRYFNLPYGDQALFVKKEMFEYIGGFPDVAIAEDLFLIRRLLELGNISILPRHIISSGRRWEDIGIFKTFIKNQMIAAGCFLGFSPSKLSFLYKIRK